MAMSTKVVDVAAEIAWRQRWLEHQEDSVGDQALRPVIESELAALLAIPATCAKCGKRWRGEMLRRYYNRAEGRCAGYSTCAERARNAAGRPQGVRR